VRPARLLAVAVLALAGTGCAGGAGGPAPPVTGTGLQELSPDPDRPNARGNIPATVGTPVEFGAASDGDDTPLQSVVVDAITAGAPCLADGYLAEQPENGQFVRLDLTVTTGPAYDSTMASGLPSLLTGWSLVGPDGEPSPGIGTYPAYVCADGGGAVLSAMRPDRTYDAVVYVDVPVDLAGTALVLGGGSEPGREWLL
jgi:hypothetical protein